MNPRRFLSSLVPLAIGLAATAACAQTVPRMTPQATRIDAAQLAQAAVAAGDNKASAFAVIDKVRARVSVYDRNGKLMGTSPVLLGLARGDDSVPGIGERKMADIRPEERTTPAGRFNSEPGRNLQGEDIVWVDYDAAISMHRVRTANKADRRLQRLATPTVADNRISYGCINVPASFYDRYVKPALGDTQGVVYVLPETVAASQRFRFLADAKATP